MVYYAIVQHSGYVIGAKIGFKQGLEEATVNRKRALEIMGMGGVVFADYVSADSYCHQEMYPGDVTGLYPKAPGKFHKRAKVGGQPVYIPEKMPLNALIVIANK